MSAAPPPADLPVSGEQVRDLCRALAAEPGVDLSSICWSEQPRRVGEGWDNTLWHVGAVGTGTWGAPGSPDRPWSDDGRLALRVVRRRAALPLREREIAALRLLAADDDLLRPMQVPRLLATGERCLLLPWIDGAPAHELTASALAETGHVLARMLARIHRPPAPGATVPGQNPVRGVPLREREAAGRSPLLRVGADAAGGGAPTVPAAQVTAAREIWEEGLRAPGHPGPPVLLHGDPHPGNVIVPPRAADPGAARAEDTHAPAGRPALIDLGDATIGDPASDVGALWLFTPRGEAVRTYLDDAAQVASDPGLQARSRAWSVHLALALLSAYPPDHGLGRAARTLLAELPGAMR